MHFYMLCIPLSEEPFTSEEHIISASIGVAALEHLHELVSLCDRACLARNPIQTYEALVSGDDLVYCPFAYGYSNYARADYAPNILCFGGLVMWGGRRLRSTLGGTGLAVSQHCKHETIRTILGNWA